jgi:hypothetical protein
MPVVWGGPDLGSQIWYLGFLPLLVMLLWLELVEEKRTAGLELQFIFLFIMFWWRGERR